MSQLKEVEDQLRELRERKKSMMEQKQKNRDERKFLISQRAKSRAKAMEYRSALRKMISELPRWMSDENFDTLDVSDMLMAIKEANEELTDSLADFFEAKRKLSELI